MIVVSMVTEKNSNLGLGHFSCWNNEKGIRKLSKSFYEKNNENLSNPKRKSLKNSLDIFEHYLNDY